MEKIRKTIEAIEKIDYSKALETQKRLDNLTKPLGSLGRLEEVARQVVEITRSENPPIKNKVIFTMAGDHGVVKEGVSAYPKEVTPQMVYNFLKGGAGINVLARHIGARVIVVDMGVAEKIHPPSLKLRGIVLRSLGEGEQNSKFKTQNFRDKKINSGTKNMAKGAAMTKDEAIKSIEAGIEVFEEELPKGIDIVGTGDMGIGNTTASSAIAACFLKKPVEDLAGRGTGINDETFLNKIAVIKKALKLNRPDPNDAIDVLSKVGGFEIGGLAGIMLAAASKRTPIVIDGFISGAAALIAYKLEPKIKDYLIASHCSAEIGHKIILNYLGLTPLLDLNLRLGEGTGAALGISIVEAAVKILTQMATFQNAGVSKKVESRE